MSYSRVGAAATIAALLIGSAAEAHMGTGLAGGFVEFFVIFASFQATVGGFSSVSGSADGVFSRFSG